jgi:hypothetical protein
VTKQDLMAKEAEHVLLGEDSFDTRLISSFGISNILYHRSYALKRWPRTLFGRFAMSLRSKTLHRRDSQGFVDMVSKMLREEKEAGNIVAMNVSLLTTRTTWRTETIDVLITWTSIYSDELYKFGARWSIE